MQEAHVVCRQCGARWRSTKQPRECENPECEAGWLDLPQFTNKADADRAAEDLTPFSWPQDADEEAATMLEP